MRMLQSGKLLELAGPGRGNVAYLPGSTGDGASYQVLVGVDKLVVLEAQENEVVNVLFNQLRASLILDRSSLEFVVCV